ncbi:D-alanine--D-alanine ligase [Erysipelothrix sp. HDW6C]|uniref:D-alanine--D-alanine ligase family protein n=1 Tax=Erysipelothrix sp. HDW6C TaxID=2714930 RepID=UPI00140741C5|nr:D-alanine--D-alanine ligase family protein [Erysipelothrix sp. HDW6C]QIK69986.1 D-alanine--D-alanine ligase [Erysipelothrix sp. HDW6C]
MKKQVALIFGSVNSEHDISVASAASVMANFPNDVFDLVPIYIGKNGKWYTGDYSLAAMEANELAGHRELNLRFDYENPGFVQVIDGKIINIDAAFLMLHGRMGEGGQIQGLLRIANIPFTGCDLLSSALCMDKGYTHLVCEASGIQMAKHQLITDAYDIDFASIEYPCIVKPSREGSSFGVTFVEDKDSLEKAVAFAFEFDSRVLIEEYIKGTEVGMGILKTKQDYIVSEVDQVNVSGDVFDFQEKYHPHATETLPVSEFPKEVRQQVQSIGEKVFKLLDCETFARIDFFVTDEHQIYLNEVNTIPGFTKTSRYPSMIARQGVDYTTLITKMVEDVL